MTPKEINDRINEHFGVLYEPHGFYINGTPATYLGDEWNPAENIADAILACEMEGLHFEIKRGKNLRGEWCYTAKAGKNSSNGYKAAETLTTALVIELDERKENISKTSVNRPTVEDLRRDGYSVKNSVIYFKNEVISVMEADRLARRMGLVYAERVVAEFESQHAETAHEMVE